MKLRFLALSIFGLASATLHAGNTGGSGPPSRQQMDELMAESLPSARMLDLNAEVQLLGTNRELTQSLTLAQKPSPMALKINEVDFAALSNGLSKNIDVTYINPASSTQVLEVAPVTKSYRIEDGNELGELVLRDRRELMRSAIQ